MEVSDIFYYKRPVKMTIDEFIQYTKENPLKFIKYCEVVLDKFGNVYMVSPSHQITLLWLYAQKNKMTYDEALKSIDQRLAVDEYIISKEKFVAIWYDMYKHSVEGMTSRQKRSINILKRNNLISTNCISVASSEYQNYIWRKENGYEY